MHFRTIPATFACVCSGGRRASPAASLVWSPLLLSPVPSQPEPEDGHHSTLKHFPLSPASPTNLCGSLRSTGPKHRVLVLLHFSALHHIVTGSPGELQEHVDQCDQQAGCLGGKEATFQQSNSSTHLCPSSPCHSSFPPSQYWGHRSELSI